MYPDRQKTWLFKRANCLQNETHLSCLISDLFLMNQFLPYGYKVVLYYSLPSEEINMMGILNPMCEAFPRVASCTFHKYGTGGLPTSTYSYPGFMIKQV